MPDRINILLVVLSLVLAIALPFELFLFSYAVLGPLHYLTQLHWLREKRFFLDAKRPGVAWMAAFLVVPSSIYAIVNTFKVTLPEPLYGALKLGGVLVLVAFVLAMLLIFSQKKIHWTVAMSIAFVSFALYHWLPGYTYIAIALLPTLIHVYLFTLLFVFYGAKKSRSTAGMLNGLVLLMVPMALIVLPDQWVLVTSNTTSDLFSDSDTFGLQSILYNLVGGDQPFRFSAPTVIKIQVFIAFAYTYHYLNWFSKTGVIGWTKGLTRWRILVVMVLWLSVVGLYGIDYQAGVSILFFLSLLHVVLEFPLNAVVIKELVKGVRGNFVR